METGKQAIAVGALDGGDAKPMDGQLHFLLRPLRLLEQALLTTKTTRTNQTKKRPRNARSFFPKKFLYNIDLFKEGDGRSSGSVPKNNGLYPRMYTRCTLGDKPVKIS